MPGAVQFPRAKFSLVAEKLSIFCYRLMLQCCTAVFRRKPSATVELSPYWGMNTRRQFATCRVADLRLHPSYVRNGLTVSASQLSALVELGDQAFLDAVVITRDRFVIDGFALLELARRRGLLTLLCVELDLNVVNAFIRILLALDLQPGWQEKALSNQRTGGQRKGSSKLTKSECVDVNL
jgi:hypothetical protein